MYSYAVYFSFNAAIFISFIFGSFWKQIKKYKNRSRLSFHILRVQQTYKTLVLSVC